MPQKIKLLRRVVERNGYRILLKKERKTLAGVWAGELQG